MIDTSGGPRVPEGNVANPGPILNDALNVNKHQEVYGEDPTNADPLKFKYLKGRWGGFSVAGATEDLTDDATNYIVVERSTGTLTVATTNTNWNNSASYARVKRIVLASGERTDDEDYRAGPGGVHGQSDAGGGASARNDVTALSSSSGVVDVDYSDGDYFTLTLTENVTSITFSNLPGSGKGATLALRITQDSTPRTVAWPASFDWSGAAPSVSTGAGDVDLLIITTFDNGTAWMANLAKDYA
jgi:hypothetical protein